VLIIAAGIAYQQFFRGPKTVVLKGYVGGEKMAFLQNQDIQNILKKKYGIEIDYTKAGSIEMVRESHGQEIDFLWPSSQVALELYKMNNQTLVKSEVIFNSPILLYSWDVVTDALIQQGIVEKIDETYYIIKFQALIDLVVEGKTWKDIGLDALYGKIAIISTDPTKSNSGNMFAGLLANILNQSGDIVDQDSLPSVLPTVQAVFARLGFMEHSSSDLFQAYLTKGVGDKPIIVGYENQIVEFSLEHEKLWPKVKDTVRILYPRPTVWSSHPLIILQERAQGLIAALQDEKIQQLAWENHGFRTGLIGVQNDPKVLDIAGIPDTITQVIPMPSPVVMDTIINTLQSGN
jgi:ABC-type Fe3+ transport system substrate-binding protein